MFLGAASRVLSLPCPGAGGTPTRRIGISHTGPASGGGELGCVLKDSRGLALASLAFWLSNLALMICFFEHKLHLGPWKMCLSKYHILCLFCWSLGSDIRIF